MAQGGAYDQGDLRAQLLPAMPETAISRDAGVQGARAGDGPHHSLDAPRYFFIRVGRSMTMSASEPPWGYKKRGKWAPLWAEQQHDGVLRLPK